MSDSSCEVQRVRFRRGAARHAGMTAVVWLALLTAGIAPTGAAQDAAPVPPAAPGAAEAPADTGITDPPEVLLLAAVFVGLVAAGVVMLTGAGLTLALTIVMLASALAAKPAVRSFAARRAGCGLVILFLMVGGAFGAAAGGISAWRIKASYGLSSPQVQLAMWGQIAGFIAGAAAGLLVLFAMKQVLRWCARRHGPLPPVAPEPRSDA